MTTPATTATGCTECRPAPCPCPTACELPEQCPTWRRGSAQAPGHGPTRAATARAIALHALAVLLAAAALVVFVKTGSSA